ncbi:MAG TPA: hypothetical protein VGQ93_04790, partial [Lysobacter sp.]|nr:hypothetical protein [Lysobacter sp.]
LKGALRSPIVRHYATITDPLEIGKLLHAIDGYQDHFVPGLRHSSRQCCLCARVNFAEPNGMKLSWTLTNGVFQPFA